MFQLVGERTTGRGKDGRASQNLCLGSWFVQQSKEWFIIVVTLQHMLCLETVHLLEEEIDTSPHNVVQEQRNFLCNIMYR